MPRLPSWNCNWCPGMFWCRSICGIFAAPVWHEIGRPWEAGYGWKAQFRMALRYMCKERCISEFHASQIRRRCSKRRRLWTWWSTWRHRKSQRPCSHASAMHQSCIFHFKGFWLSFHALTFVPTCPDHTTNLDALVFPSCAVFPRKTLEAHEGIWRVAQVKQMLSLPMKFAQDAAEKTAFKQARNMDKKATKILADSWQELLLLASILAPILATS